MRLEQKINLKAGVSLIAVLLFMLIATIAATATYKWITSESRSSSSRMLEREAYQSAVAGIESARSWMTYHANDVGALIKQYKDNGNAAIKLNSQLVELVRPGQKFNVWLTGVTTENTTYKLKLVSEGEARNGQAKHTEVAILNVNGLYRVKRSGNHGALNFEEAFQGRTPGITGSDTMKSGIVNGDFVTSNTPRIGNLLVTGNANYGGTVTQSGNLYVRGNLSADGPFNIGTAGADNVVYVGGNVTCPSNQSIKIEGDLYVGGNVGAACAIDVSGNMTIGGKLDRSSTGTHKFTVGKNLVFKDEAELDYSVNLSFGTNPEENGSGVGGSTYLSKISGTKGNYDKKMINLGSPIYLYTSFSVNSASASVCSVESCSNNYCQGFFEGCNGSGSTGAIDDRFFLFYSTGNNVSSSTVSSWSPTDGVLKNVSDNYWTNIEKMNEYGNKIDAATNEVPQAILLKDTAAWIQKLANELCDIKPNFLMDDASIKKLNKCYNTAASSGQLYEGFLPIRWDYAGKGGEIKEKLEHNFILYVPRQLGQTELPPTADNAVVLLYLGRGATGELMGNKKKKYNYFVYSKGDIAQIQGVQFYGTVMMEPGKTVTKIQGESKFEYSKTVIQTLVNAGLIEENPAYTNLVNSGSAGTGVDILDDYYIATAPQLSITIETQYANKESISNLTGNAQDPEASFIVLPRIIYLSKTPAGTLNQYFSVVPLNSKTSVSNPSVNCANNIPVGTALLSDVKHELEPGTYTCYVTGTIAGRQSTVPLYVVVADEGGTPHVSFVDGWKELRPNDETTVALTVPVASGAAAQSFEVTVSPPTNVGNDWTVTPINPTGTCPDPSNGGKCVFTISAAVGTTDIFAVKNVSATSGQVDFQIVDCGGGCIIGNPYLETILVSANVPVRRASLETWCTANETSASAADKAKCAKKTAPDCESNSEWVRAKGVLCSTLETNDSWNCKNTGGVSLQTLDGYIPAGCEAVVPGENLITQSVMAAAESEVLLYASLKAKQLTFSVGFNTETDISSNQTIRISATYPGATDPITSNCSYADYKDAAKYAEKCQVKVYYGSTVTLSFPENKDKVDFNYWMCESGTDCPSPKVPYPENTYTLQVTGNNVVHAHFKESDQHCFFDEFKNASYKNGDYLGTYTNRSNLVCSESNPEKEYCVDVTRSHPKAKWRLVSGDSDDIEFNGDGRVSLKSSATRRYSEGAKKSVTIMSTVTAGGYGTLKAQFQVPREEAAAHNEAKATVKQSGFLLRSSEDATSYLMLNVFSDVNDHLKARICVNGGNTCKTKDFVQNGTGVGNAYVRQGSIILVSVTFAKNNEGHDILTVDAYTDAFSTAYKSVSFELTQSELNGVEDLSDSYNHYVGFRLSDQNFKIYGIGWKSEDYSSRCWDTSPSISCSFRAAYTGGLVPKGQNTKPWVGFSRWFGNDGCAPIYYYNGSDAGCFGTALGTSNYRLCSSDGYNFSAVGLHGNTIEVNGAVEDGNKTARVGVSGSSCDIYGEEAAWANSAVAHCGSFWVGDFTNCTEHKLLQETISGAEGVYYGVDAVGGMANFRGANLVVTMNNPNGAEVTTYLFSQNSANDYTYGSDAIYSLPYTSTIAGNAISLNINVNDLSNVEGFDPEHVVGVYVKYDQMQGVEITSVQSRCSYAMSLFNCRAEYNNESEKWHVSATISNGSVEQIKKLDLTRVSVNGSETNLTNNARDCSAEPSECTFTGDDIEWEIDLGHTPYYNMGRTGTSADYQFWVTMTDYNDANVEGSPCVTHPTSVPRIETSCYIAENARSRKRGLGVPVMTYSIIGCPEASAESKKCGYTVKIKKDGADVVTVAENDAVNGNVSNVVTSESAANTDTKLAIGTYKMVLESSAAEYPFASCEQEFEITDENTPTGNLSCTMPENVMKGSTRSISVISSLPRQQYRVYLDDASTASWTGYIDKGYGKAAGPITVPNDEATHTFKIISLDDGEVQCVGQFNTSGALTCKIESKVELNVSNVFMVDALDGVSVTSCTYSNNLTCSNCGTSPLSDRMFKVESTDPVTLSVECVLANGEKASCSAVAQAVVEPPTLTCPEDPIYAEWHSTVMVSPIKVENCTGGCSYRVDSPIGTEKAKGTITTQTSVTFPASSSRTGLNEYKLYVENTAGSVDCVIPVVYNVPKYSCPDDMKVPVGSQVEVHLRDVRNCGWGMYATGDCSYSIEGGEFVDKTTSGTGYKHGPLPKKIKGESSATEKEYKVTLARGTDAGPSCSFNVSYVNWSCGCTCSSGCDKLKNNSLEGSQKTTSCIYATSIKEINENYGQNEIKVNGVDIGYCSHAATNNSELCSVKLEGMDKIDDGYYIEVMPTVGCRNPDRNNESCDWIKVEVEPLPVGSEKPSCTIE